MKIAMPEDEDDLPDLSHLEGKVKIILGENALEKAEEFSEAVKGEIYTQVDSGEDRVYVKGVETVNRTGVYLVNYIGGDE